MKTISQAAEAFALSRSTLLYYDKIGICRPTYRTAAGYRLYSEEDINKLKLICEYRQSGMSLKMVSSIIEDPVPSRIVDALNEQLKRLNSEIGTLRKQQSVILNLLKSYKSEKPTHVMNKEAWIHLLESCGMNDADMERWHRMFEQQSPEAHQDFLESLSIPPEEIGIIRKKAQGKGRAIAG